MNVARIPANWSLCAALLLSATGLVFAQDSNSVGRISGQVVDETGQPVPNAKLRFVPIHDLKAKVPADVTTNKKGKFTVGFFPVGAYRPELISEDHFIVKMDFKDRTFVSNVSGGSAEGEDMKVGSGDVEAARHTAGKAIVAKSSFTLTSNSSVDMTLTIKKGAPLKVAADGKSPIEVANELFQKQDNDGVLAATERILAVEPENGPAMYLRGVTYLRMRKGEEAVPLLRKAAVIMPKQPGIRALLGNALMDQGSAMATAGKEEEAKPVFAEAADLLQADAATMADPTGLLTNAVYALQRAGKADEALAVMGKLIESDPENVTLRLAYINALTKAGKKAEADQASAEIESLTPADDSQRIRLAEALSNSGKNEAALRLVESMDVTSRDIAAVLYNICAGLMNEGKAEKALPHLERAAKGQPELAFLRRGLALAYLGQSRYADAVPHLREALRLEPNGPNAATDKELLEKLEKAKK